MKQNDTFKDMLANYQPDLGDSDEYMSSLQRKLEAIESVKSMYQEECIQMRKRMIVAFVSGIIAGAGAAFYLLLHPAALALSNHFPSWISTSHILPIIAIVAFSSLSAVFCTLLYQIFKKDFSESSFPI